MQAATFRPGGPARRSMLHEALSLAWAALFRGPSPDCGLVIHKTLYNQLGGHRADAEDPERDLLRRLGRARITTLRCSASVT
jgi:hypothetical protein